MDRALPLGIQLGSHRCSAAVYQDGRVVTVPGPDGRVGLPMLVAVREDGRVVVGSEAQELRDCHPDRVATDFLRWLGRDHRVELLGHELEATLLVSLILGHLKADAEQHLGHSQEECVISVPGRFDERQRRAVLHAASLAGLDVVRLVEEPLAAAWSSWRQRPRSGFSVVLDMGARSFDVSVLEHSARKSRVVALDGEDNLGGEAYTDRMLDWILGREGLPLELAEFYEPDYVARLRAEVESSKQVLSAPDAEAVEVEYPEREGRSEDDESSCVIDGVLFESITRSLTARLEAPVRRVLLDCGLDLHEVDEVLLVGGGAHMPVLQGLARRIFGSDVSTPHDPESAAVRGTAFQAALISGAVPQDTPCTQTTLGVEVTRELGGLAVGGYFLPLVPRGSVLPATFEEQLETAQADQRQIFLRFFAGDSNRVSSNAFLGELAIEGLEPAPAGQVLDMRLHLDVSGCVAIEVRPEGSSQISRGVFRLDGQQVSELERERMLRELDRQLHSHRNEVDDQRLVRFAEQTATLLSMPDRFWLEQVLDAFRELLPDGPDLTLQVVRRDLLGTLSQLGYSYGERHGSSSGGERQDGWRLDRPEEGAA